MSGGSDYVERRALEWAATDRKALSAAELRYVIDDYLASTNPFSDGMIVETRGVDADRHLERAVITNRVAHAEWNVEFDDGTEAYRGAEELSPVGTSL